MYVLHPLFEPWDVAPFWGPGALVLTQKAREALGGFFRRQRVGSYEFLDLPVNGKSFVVLNITEVVNCLDYEHTDFQRLTPEVSLPERYAFFPKRFTTSLFKLPEIPAGTVFVAEDDARGPEWSFKWHYEQASLKGIFFEQVWESS